MILLTTIYRAKKRIKDYFFIFMGVNHIPMTKMVSDFKNVGNNIGVEVKGLKKAVCGKKGCDNLKKSLDKEFNEML